MGKRDLKSVAGAFLIIVGIVGGLGGLINSNYLVFLMFMASILAGVYIIGD